MFRAFISLGLFDIDLPILKFPLFSFGFLDLPFLLNFDILKFIAPVYSQLYIVLKLNEPLNNLSTICSGDYFSFSFEIIFSSNSFVIFSGFPFLLFSLPLFSCAFSALYLPLHLFSSLAIVE